MLRDAFSHSGSPASSRQVAAIRFEAEPKLANSAQHGRAGPCEMTKARLIADAAKEVSQPNRTGIDTLVAVEGQRWRGVWR
jgi:hypothetical protein